MPCKLERTVKLEWRNLFSANPLQRCVPRVISSLELDVQQKLNLEFGRVVHVAPKLFFWSYSFNVLAN